MSDEGVARLERVMEAGFRTLADLTRETNEELAETNVRLGRVEERLENVDERLERVEERLERVEGGLGRVVIRLESIEGRFDNLIDLAGTENRRLREDLEDLERRVEALEKRA